MVEKTESGRSRGELRPNFFNALENPRSSSLLKEQMGDKWDTVGHPKCWRMLLRRWKTSARQMVDAAKCPRQTVCKGADVRMEQALLRDLENKL